MRHYPTALAGLPPSSVAVAAVALCLCVGASVAEDKSAKPPGAAPHELGVVSVAADGCGFVVDGMPWAPFGVNYFDPDTGWAPKLWREFRAERVEEHFRLMSRLGVNTVRVFTTAASFIPDPPRLSDDALRKFDQLLEIAGRHSIRVHPTGPDHWEGNPAWRRRDIFTDPTALEVQVAFWKQFSRRYEKDPRIFAFDLLNEPHVRWKAPAMLEGFRGWLRSRYGTAEKLREAWGTAGEINFESAQVPEDRAAPKSSALLDYQLYRESVAEDWVRTQVKAIRDADPSRLVTVGLIQWSVPVLLSRPSLYSAFRPSRVTGLVDFASIHFYPLYGDPLTDTATFDRNLAYLEFVLRSARGDKPLVLAEFGWYGGGKPDRHVERRPEEQLKWNRALVQQSRNLVCGWLNWAWSDTPSSRDITKYSGLVTAESGVKPWGQAFESLAKTLSTARMGGKDSSKVAFAFEYAAAICDPAAGKRALARYAESWKKTRSLEIDLR